MRTRTPYPSDVSDDEGAFVAPYLIVLSEDTLQRKHDLRAVFNAARWLRAGCFEAIAYDLRLVLRLAAGQRGQRGGDPGPRAFGAWSVTMSACHRRSPG